MQGGAGGGGDDANALNIGGQGLFVCLVKQAFGREPLFELEKGRLQGAITDRLHGGGNQLIITAALVEAEPAKNHDLVALFWTIFIVGQLATKHRAADLRIGILEREIDMTGRRSTQGRNFAAHRYRRVLGFQQLLHLPIELGNR